MTKQKVIMRCTHCGSADVSRTAEARWNVARQAWMLCATYDDATCNYCEGETSLYESHVMHQRTQADLAAERAERAAVQSVRGDAS